VSFPPFGIANGAAGRYCRRALFDAAIVGRPVAPDRMRMDAGQRTSGLYGASRSTEEFEWKCARDIDRFRVTKHEKGLKESGTTGPKSFSKSAAGALSL
jgi:hypothetical protein